jgi:hypothetical protein
MIKTNSTSNMDIFSTGGSSGLYNNFFEYYFQISFCGDAGKLVLVWVLVGPGYGSYCVGKILNDNNWHTVLVTFDETTLTLYEDGIYQYTTTPLPAINTIGNSYNYIGKVVAFGNFIGALKNVVYYDYVVAPSDGNNMYIYIQIF